MTYDLAVIGLGGMGSAIVSEAARRKAKVIGIDQFESGHELGASSGKTRLIRKAYFEDPAYVPLLRRVYDLWSELENISGESLLQKTGLLTVATEESDIRRGTLRAAQEHDIPIDVLNRAQVEARFPGVRLLPDEAGLFEPEGGVVFPERAIAAQLRIARQNGAELRFQTAMTSWQAGGDAFEIETSQGAALRTRSIAFALGPWFERFGEDLHIPLQLQRNVQAWFAPTTGAYVASKFPAFLLERDTLPAPFYGTPDFGEGVKVAFHGWGEMTEADKLKREVDEKLDVEPLRSALAGWMPGAAGTHLSSKPCMYSLTPDRHFVIDRHPQHERLIICGGFSGHGFKFAPVVGEIAADLALEGGTGHGISFLSLERFRTTVS